MKKLNIKLIIFSLIFGMLINPMFSQKVFFIENEKLDKTSGYLNLETNKIDFDVSSFGVEFKFLDNTFEKLGKTYDPEFLVKGNDNMFMVMNYYYSGVFDRILFVEGDYKKLKKEIEGGNIGTKTTIIKTIKPEGSTHLKFPEFISESRLDSKLKKLKEEKINIENYNSSTNLKDFIGTYELQFNNHSNYSVDSKGIMYITDEGITIKCEDIFSLKLIRSSHNKSFPKTWDEGNFYCKITKGYGNDLMVVLDKEKLSFGFTTSSGSSSKTSSGTVIRFTP